MKGTREGIVTKYDQNNITICIIYMRTCHNEIHYYVQLICGNKIFIKDGGSH